MEEPTEDAILIPDESPVECDYFSDHEYRPKASFNYFINRFFQILIHLFKSNIGVGLLNMPENMSRAGVLLGPLVSLFIILPIIHCMLLLLKCSREIKRRTGKRTIGYAGTFRYSLIEHLGPNARYFAYVGNFYLLCSQIGVCVVYVTFAAQTLYEVTEKYFSDIRIYMLIISLIIIPPALISRLDIMSILSGSANALCLFSLTCTLVYIFKNVKSPTNYPLVGDLRKFPLFIASVMYVFEGINVVVPLDHEIDNPDRYPLALKIATYTCAFIYFFIGLLGYLAYGENVRSSITLNLPVQPFTNVVKLVYAIGITLTFFIQFHIAMNVMMPTILKKVQNRQRHNLTSSFVRLGFALLIIMIAIVVPQLNNLISLIGAFSCASLSLILPCVIHLATFWNNQDENRLTTFELTKDFVIIVVGVIMTFTGVFASIVEIVNDYKKPSV